MNVVALVSRLINSDLENRLYNNQKPTLTQLATLAVPGVVRALERLWYMPVTGQTKFFLLNYPFHHYTVGWENYHDDVTAFGLAAADGYLDVVRAMVDEDPSITVRSICQEFYFDRPNVSMMARRGRVEIVKFLIDDIKSKWFDLDKDDKLHFKYTHVGMFYYAICSAGNMELFNKLKTQIYIHQFKVSWDFAFDAAIKAGHLNIVKALEALDKKIQADLDNGLDPRFKLKYGDGQSINNGKVQKRLNRRPIENLNQALRSGQLEIIQYLLGRQPVTSLDQDQKDNLVKSSLLSGNPKIVNMVLGLTKVKFNTDHIFNAVMSGTISIVKRFQRQFSESFNDIMAKSTEQLFEFPSPIDSYPIASDVAIFVFDHGVNDWDQILSHVVSYPNLAIIDAVARRIGAKTTLEQISEKPKISEYLQTMIEEGL